MCEKAHRIQHRCCRRGRLTQRELWSPPGQFISVRAPDGAPGLKEKQLTGEKGAPTARGQKVHGLEGWVIWHGWSLTQVASGEGDDYYHQADPSLNVTSKRPCLTIPTKNAVISYGLTLFCFFYCDIWHSLKLNLNYWVFCLHSPQPEHKSLIRARPLFVLFIIVSPTLITESSRCSRNKVLKWPDGDFPGGPLDKASPSNAGGVGSIPGWGAKKIPHASWSKNQSAIWK